MGLRVCCRLQGRARFGLLAQSLRLWDEGRMVWGLRIQAVGLVRVLSSLDSSRTVGNARLRADSLVQTLLGFRIWSTGESSFSGCERLGYGSW